MKFTLRATVLSGVVALMLGVPAYSQTIETSAGRLSATVVAEGLEFPWGLALLPDGRMLVTERTGQLRLIADGTVGEPIAGVPVVLDEGQAGLLDIAIARDFATSGMVYMTFVETAEQAGKPEGVGTAVVAARLVLDGATGRLEDSKVILRMNNYTYTFVHYGSRVVVGLDGNLFVTLGDRENGMRAQDGSDLAGAVARIAPDGSIPGDNPNVDGWAPELWSKGHRNPQGATLREDGQLFLVDHGEWGGDEVNMPLAGRNYGWPLISYGKSYSGGSFPATAQDGLEQPLHYWDPSIAPSGLDFYEGDLIPEWQGDLLLGALSGNKLVRLDMSGDTVVGEEALFSGQFGRIRDVKVSPRGDIYLLTDEENGKLIRVAPEGR
ncbi:MAG: PQQ-dependent sugar dehydrogenase [Candidatus Devosia phytovorans]|uniref:PQQ-dependent sugar dehydrogenase n=1 Tax=Candidatus Devosia phytovorans TaxID=3121372 RepID=A0AAJ5VXP1_9HYPH|nr:PQQ-dependent sugar dehydrogenase [Devosia sp.]WEK05403.1 MAG: PQQ-dependent sugar dehydrogenase [Devosia sp.]